MPRTAGRFAESLEGQLGSPPFGAAQRRPALPKHPLLQSGGSAPPAGDEETWRLQAVARLLRPKAPLDVIKRMTWHQPVGCRRSPPPSPPPSLLRARKRHPQHPLAKLALYLLDRPSFRNRVAHLGGEAASGTRASSASAVPQSCPLLDHGDPWSPPPWPTCCQGGLGWL